MSEDGTAPAVRLPLALLAVVTVCALATAAIVLWRAVPSAAGGAHGLDADRAACLDFGLFERRMEMSITRKAQHDLDLPTVTQTRKRLRGEIKALDALVREHRSADYRLVDSFSAVADASAAALVEPRVGGASDYFVDGLVGRFDAVDAAKQRCVRAGFDAEDLEPR